MELCDRLVTRAKLEIMQDAAAKFFMTFLMHYPPVWNAEIRTACIGGRVQYVNPTWFSTLTPLEGAGLLLHETLHVAFKHNIRGKGKDPDIWGKAVDYWVNSWILDNTRLKLPAGGLWDSKYTWHMDVETIYKDLLDSWPSLNPQAWGEDDCTSFPPQSESDVKMEAAHIDQLLIQATIVAEQNRQALPGGIARIIHELRNPSLPWDTMLEKWAKDRSYFSYNWSKPNRRHTEVFIPAKGNRGHLRRMVFAVDVSGSIEPDQFDFIISQVEHARRIIGIEECILILFDDKVQAVHTFDISTPINSVELIGFGGTELDPMLEEAVKWNPDVLVVFTDMGVNPPTVEYFGDSLWLVLDNPRRDGPFGESIHIDLRSNLC